MRSRRVFRFIWNCPPLLVPQMKVSLLSLGGFWLVNAIAHS
jgi:hypothetical protein